MSTRVPPEVWSEILSLVPRDSLCRVCLVNKDLRSLASPVLYHDVVVDRNMTTAFCHTVLNSDTLAAHVRLLLTKGEGNVDLLLADIRRLHGLRYLTLQVQLQSAAHHSALGRLFFPRLIACILKVSSSAPPFTDNVRDFLHNHSMTLHELSFCPPPIENFCASVSLPALRRFFGPSRMVPRIAVQRLTEVSVLWPAHASAGDIDEVLSALATVAEAPFTFSNSYQKSPATGNFERLLDSISRRLPNVETLCIEEDVDRGNATREYVLEHLGRFTVLKVLWIGVTSHKPQPSPLTLSFDPRAKLAFQPATVGYAWKKIERQWVQYEPGRLFRPFAGLPGLMPFNPNVVS
ncbi:hypothetical protein B0H13DRAFT_2325080 [Mycena leptocephala]|nr:hypothetical protein B0H13DRAFT_2325080 [Mycena leptocephala]